VEYLVPVKKLPSMAYIKMKFQRNKITVGNMYTGVYLAYMSISELDVRGSVHRNIDLIEITNKMRPCNRIY
jgi:hypothetical protein